MIVDSLSYIFSNTCVNVRISSLFSDSWVTTRGVRQRGVLSAFLFSLYLDDILTEISAMPVGCRLVINKINVQAYADDIILFSPTAGGLQLLLDRIVILVEQIDLNIYIFLFNLMPIKQRLWYSGLVASIENVDFLLILVAPL